SLASLASLASGGPPPTAASLPSERVPARAASVAPAEPTPGSTAMADAGGSAPLHSTPDPVEAAPAAHKGATRRTVSDGRPAPSAAPRVGPSRPASPEGPPSEVPGAYDERL